MRVGLARWTFLIVAAALAGLVVTNCTMLGLNYASLETDNKPAPQPVMEVAGLDAWTHRKDELKEAFAGNVYGPWPDGLAVELISRRLVEPAYVGGRGRLEELLLQIGRGKGARQVHLGLAVPDGEGPFPVIIGQTFAPNCNAFASTQLSGSNGQACKSANAPFIFRFIFGEFIARAPVEAYLDAGFAYASFHASEFVPDSQERAGPVLAELQRQAGQGPTGTIMAWAFVYSAAIDVFSEDDRIDPDRIAVFGHSRHGKSALVAGAWDERIDVVISHQSGFGGAALSRSAVGEGVARITSTYPHWFDPAYGALGEDTNRLPVDQHQLIALIAPRPVFLGNARRDVWSDPNSTYRAAQAASTVWQLHGEAGLDQDGLADWTPDANLAYWLRNGGHGTDQRDVDAMLAFLKAHFPPRSAIACQSEETAFRPQKGCQGALPAK